MTNVVNLLLDSEEHATFRTQAKSVDTKDLAGLEAYVIEALSEYGILGMKSFITFLLAGIDPPFAGVCYVAKKTHTVGSLAVEQGEHLFLDVASAGMNVSVSFNPSSASLTWQQEEAFPNPSTFDATRTPRERYLRAETAFKVVGADIPPKLIVQVLRSILSLDNIRRGPGQSGKLQRFQDSSLKDLRYVYLDAHQFRSPWPTSLVVLYDDPSSAA